MATTTAFSENQIEAPVVTSRRRTWRRPLLLAGPIILIVSALFLYVHGGRVVSSDNAYVHSDKLTVTTEVAGTVKEVLVHDNDHVTSGQVLFRLDDEPYRIAVAQAAAQLNTARIELAALRSSYRQKLAATDEAREALSFAEHELQRQENLRQRDVSTEAALDQARHEVES